MKDWYSSIYKAFIISAIISFIIGFFSGGKVSLGSYIAGYSALSLGITMILLLVLSNLMKTSEEPTIIQIILTTGPFILMIGVIAFILYLMIQYQSIILSNHVPSGYNLLRNIKKIKQSLTNLYLCLLKKFLSE